MENSTGGAEVQQGPAQGTDVEDVRLDSVTLARLLAEVRNAEPAEPNAYNRMHNRHNR